MAGQEALSDSGSFGNTRACTVMFSNVDMTMGDKIEPLFNHYMDGPAVGRITLFDRMGRGRAHPECYLGRGHVGERAGEGRGWRFSAARSVARKLALSFLIGRGRCASGRNIGPDDRYQSCRQSDPGRHSADRKTKSLQIGANAYVVGARAITSM